jgi:D-alanine-D-alanine ligase
MESEIRRTDLPVLLLHNIDTSWEAEETACTVDSVNKMKFALMQEGHPVVDVPVKSTDLVKILKRFRPEEHIVLNWCEELPGIPRSDAEVVRQLEKMKFSYTGSTAEVLSMSWNKAAVKALLNEKQIPTPSWKVVSDQKPPDWDCFPAIVKPAFEHCSNGITTDAVVLNHAELMKRVAFVQNRFRQPALVEDFIDGREFHVTIWGNGSIEILPPAEMDFSAFNNLKDRLCTFDSKFTPGSVHYEKIEIRIPAALDEQENLELKKISLRAYQMMGCRDYARIDLRLRNSIFYVLDVNPNADISPDTSLVYAAEAAGLTYGILCSRLVNFAAQRHPIYGCREN